MRKQRFFAAVTAAAIALSSVAAFPSETFAASKQGTYSFTPDTSGPQYTVEMNTEEFTTTEIFGFGIWDLMDDIKASTGDDIFEDSVMVTKASFTYTVTGEGDDIGVYVAGSGFDSSGNWVEGLGCDPWYSEKSGTITTDDDQFANSVVKSYNWIGIGASGKGTGELTLNVTGVELEFSYDAIENIPVTGTEKYTFDDSYLQDVYNNPVFTVGYAPFWEDYYLGDWLQEQDQDNVEALKGISTVEDFVSKYGSLEFKFKAEDIQGDVEVYALIELIDKSKNIYQNICLPAQDVTEGKNVYTVDFNGNILSALSAFNSVSVHFHSKTEGETAKFTLGLYDSINITATGTETFKTSIESDRDMTVSVETPEWWNPEWGSLYRADTSVWNCHNMGDGYNNCLVNTVPELYSTYKGGEIAFNISDLNADVTCRVILQTRDGDEWGEDFVLSDNNTLQNGLNTIKFDLPKISYVNPDIWGIILTFLADEATEFTIGWPIIPVTGTEKYTFDDSYIHYNNPVTVGYETFDEDYHIGDWLQDQDQDNVEALKGISTIEDFVSKYGSLEVKFKAEDIQGDIEVYAMIVVAGDKSKDDYRRIYLPAQDVTEGKNVYSVDFDGNIKAAYSDFDSVTVHFRSKTEGETAKFAIGPYDSNTVAATGTETFKSGIATDEDLTVSIETPEWWDPEWGSLYTGFAGSWYYGMGEGTNNCLANTIPELYSTYKGGEITFNVKNLSADVTYNVILQTRVGDEYGKEFVLSDNNTLQNGLNTVKFDLPKIMYLDPDIWGLCLTFYADGATEFTIGNPEASTPSTSEPGYFTPPASEPETSEPITSEPEASEPTASEPEASKPTASEPEASEPTASESEASEPTASEPAASDTNEVFNTQEKPIEDIMDEIKSDTTASIEVAAEDTTIKADTFEAAKSKNVTLELKLDNGVKWEIKAETIGDGAADVNINVELNTSNVPAESVEAVAEGKSTMQISLAHNGSFGFEANITIPVAPTNDGKVANLFHFNNGTLEFVASVTVSNGEAILPFSHASEYVIVFDEKSMGDSDSASVSNTDSNPGTGASSVGAFAILAAVSATAVIICRKNKHN